VLCIILQTLISSTSCSSVWEKVSGVKIFLTVEPTTCGEILWRMDGCVWMYVCDFCSRGLGKNYYVSSIYI